MTNVPPTKTSPKSGCPKAKPKEVELPPYNIPYCPKRPATVTEIEKLRTKTIRRNAPPGEDPCCMKKVLATVKDRPDITVQEFVALIAASTGDRGEALRIVMNDDLTNFRKLARKVYETITQDNSDVLLNQQLQLSEFYREKRNLLDNKMMKTIEQIYAMAPNFDFDKFHKEDRKEYLDEILPIPEELELETEEVEMMKRQAAYHRLQWLRSEGERLADENNALKRRLHQMKKMQMEDQRRLSELERQAEAKKERLEATEAAKQRALEQLNESIEQTIIDQEMALRLKADNKVLEPIPPRSVTDKKKKKTRRLRTSEWNELAANEIESCVIEGYKRSEIIKSQQCYDTPPVAHPYRTPSPPPASLPVCRHQNSPPGQDGCPPLCKQHVVRPVSPARQACPSKPQASTCPRPQHLVQRPISPARQTSSSPQASTSPRICKPAKASPPPDTWGGYY